MSPHNDLHEAMDVDGMGIRQAMDAWLGAIELGEEQPLGALRVSPLVHRGPHELAFVLLHEALEAKVLEIVEQGGGNVNEIIAHNRGERAVLILEGESVVGAKQNRVVVDDVVVAPGSMVAVPVGCVEHGRWHLTSSAFRCAPMPLELGVRCKNVQEAVMAGRMDQGRLWRDVEAKLGSSRAHSATQDYHQHARMWEADVMEQSGRIKPVADQVGMLVTAEGMLLGLDLLGHPGNWASYAPRAVSSYALSGVSRGWQAFVAEASQHAKPRPAKEWLHAVAAARMRVRPAYGIGLQLRIEGEGIVGGGLWVVNRPAHVAAFARS